MAYVYRHIRLDKNEPFYIGIGSDNTYQRANSNYKKHRNKIWNDIANKSEYEVEIIVDDLTWEQACEKEKEFILLYGRKDLNTGTLCNLTNGGEGVLGNKLTQSQKEHLSKIQKGRVLSVETKLKMSKSKTGVKISEQARINFSKAQMGNTKSKGKKASESTKLKQSIARTNYYKNGGIKIFPLNYGNNFKGKMVINLQNGIFYENIKSAAESINMNRCTLEYRLKKNIDKHFSYA
jgi:hypothetical protein